MKLIFLDLQQLPPQRQDGQQRPEPLPDVHPGANVIKHFFVRKFQIFIIS